MKKTVHSRWLIVGALIVNAACWPLQAVAEEATQLITKDTTEIFGNAAVDSENLEISRGGADLNLFDVKNDGIVSENHASNLTTGSNWVTEGLFAGVSGFLTVVQNSGNNVLIQNFTVINL